MIIKLDKDTIDEIGLEHLHSLKRNIIENPDGYESYFYISSYNIQEYKLYSSNILPLIRKIMKIGKKACIEISINTSRDIREVNKDIRNLESLRKNKNIYLKVNFINNDTGK